jgi:hypothetical protein
MGNSVKMQKAAGEDVFRLIPVTEEKRLLKKIEDSSTKEIRNELEQNLNRYGEENKLRLLIQIANMIDVSKKSESALLKMEKKAGFDIVPTKYMDVRPTLRYIADSAKVLPAEQLNDMVLIATKLAERKKETKDAIQHLHKLSSGLPDSSQRLLALSIKLVEKDMDLASFLSPIVKMTPKTRALCLDGLISLSEEMIEKGNNPKPVVSYICELPSDILEVHSEKILGLSMKLAKRGVDPKSTVWSISLIPRKSVDIGSILSSSISLADDMDPTQKILLISENLPKLIDRKQLDRVLKLAHANVNRGWMDIEKCWEMEKSMNSLLSYSTEEFNEASKIAVELLKHNRNPNDLFLLARSVAQYSPEQFDESVRKLGVITSKIKPFDAPLAPIFYRSLGFRESGFENFVFYKLSKTLQDEPGKFPEQLSEVLEKLESGVNPEVVFKKTKSA